MRGSVLIRGNLFRWIVPEGDLGSCWPPLRLTSMVFLASLAALRKAPGRVYIQFEQAANESLFECDWQLVVNDVGAGDGYCAGQRVVGGADGSAEVFWAGCCLLLGLGEQATCGGYQCFRVNHRFCRSCSRSRPYVMTVDSVMPASASGASVRRCSVAMSIGSSSGSSAR